MTQTNDVPVKTEKKPVPIGETKFGRTTYDMCCVFADKGKTFEERLLSLAKKEKFD